MWVDSENMSNSDFALRTGQWEDAADVVGRYGGPQSGGRIEDKSEIGRSQIIPVCSELKLRETRMAYNH